MNWTADQWVLFLGGIGTLLAGIYAIYKGLISVSINAAEKQISRLTTRLEEAERRIDARDSLVDDLRSSNHQLRIEIGKHVVELSTMENEVSQLRENAAAMLIRVSNLENERRRLTSEIEKLKKENQNLRKRLSDAERGKEKGDGL
jgi:peptidoglycan hydrolase CwlO-like protein